MAGAIFVIVPIALVAILGVSAVVRGLRERQAVFRAEEPPELQLEEQERLKALREAEERIHKRSRNRRS